VDESLLFLKARERGQRPVDKIHFKPRILKLCLFDRCSDDPILF